MNFERSDILIPLLDSLSENDQKLFREVQQRILGEFTARGTAMSPAAVTSIAAAFRDEIEGRGHRILSEMCRVLAGAPIHDFDRLRDELNAELSARLEAAENLASSEFRRVTEFIRKNLGGLCLPTTAISQHVGQLKPKLLAEIDLLCAKLHDSQPPRLFLKAGEVFGGNRAARRIFTAAKQTLDIIDKWFGPEVFDMLEVTQQSLKIRLISGKATKPTKLAYELFNQQFGERAEFRICDPKDIHDRFIIVDGQSALHVGASIKDWGKSDSLIDSALLVPHKQRFEELWLKGSVVI